MIFKQSAMAAILFFKMRQKIFRAKKLQARTSHGPFLHSEALGAIIRKIQGRFSMMTLLIFDLEAGVNGQIQRLENIIRL